MILACGMLLDALLGEPKWLWSRVPHPAVLMGRCVSQLDHALNKGRDRRLKGILCLLVLIGGAGLGGFILAAVPGQIIDLVCLAILLAHKSLVAHVAAVASGLRISLAQGRRSVAMIVGRDTAAMDQSAVARGAIESAAENLSDGVIAPIFWFLVGGLPGLFIYKITNTADSMIGYRTPKHAEFGGASAKFDDLLNLIPARLTALLIWLTMPDRGTPSLIIAEAPRHRSPNAGWPEAAMAHRLGIALSGPRSYEGTLKTFPFVNPNGKRELTQKDIDDTTLILWQVWAICFVAVLVIALF